MKAVAATGMLGTGFDVASLEAAAAGAAFIGCDAGSTDPGPHYLGSGEVQVPRDAAARDLEAMLATGLARGIPVLVGSAGTAGGRPHLEWTLEIVRELAAANGWHFTLASIDSELAPERVADALVAGRLSPLAAAPAIDADTIAGSERIVAMMGAEPFVLARSMGADVIVAGRSSDTSIFAAVPLLHGIPRAVAWHAGKVLECGAACVRHRLRPDSMVAELDRDGFTVRPPNPALACTPASVASHALYETSDPLLLVEPGGVLDTSGCEYTALDDRTVRVSAGRFTPSETYTVRLEGAALAGYRSLAIGGISDPLVVGQLDRFLAEVRDVVAAKVRQSLRVEPGSYTLQTRVYGREEVGVVIDVVAPRQRLAADIVAIAWHTALHHPIPEYSGLVSQLAFPYSPPGLDAGPVYRFCLNHVLTLDDPCADFSVSLERL